MDSQMQALSCDLKRYGNASIPSVLKAIYNHPSVLGVLWYRVGRAWWLRRKNPLFLILLFINRAFYPLIRIYSGLELSVKTQVGPGLYVGHFGPCVIHPDAVIGSNVSLMHGVTIGLTKTGVPHIGDNVSVGTGAVIIGGITLGDNVFVGANAVVTRSFESDTVLVGIPARPL